MTPSDNCLDLIKRHEGLRLKAYLCPAGIWTIGYGHTWDVKPNHRVTTEEANFMVLGDACHASEALQGLKLTQNQFDALTSFVFNVGKTAFDKSTMRRELLAGNFEAAAAEFPRWVRAAGKVMPGLVVRRDEERALFERP